MTLKPFTFKSFFYLPLMALSIGILPVLLLPSSEVYPLLNGPPGPIAEANAPIFPFNFNAHTLDWTIFALLLPIICMLWAFLRQQKTYHGLYALFISLGFLIKAQALDSLSYAVLCIMTVAAAINIMVYLVANNETFDDWLSFYFSESKLSRVKAKLGLSNSGTSNSSVATLEYPARQSQRNFKTVAGMVELKAKLLKAGHEILNQPNARNGILLTGEPGNGKTSMAEALAGELKLPIIDVAIGNFQSMWVGETTQKVMKVFDDAIAQAPCVLFIDEIEAILVNRSGPTSTDQEAPKTVAAILKRTVDLRRHKVVLIAATNYLEKLDPASIREGRFDYKIEVTPPDDVARLFLLQDGLKNFRKILDVDGLRRAAMRWEGFSVSRIRAVVSQIIDQYQTNPTTQIGFDECAKALRSLSATKGDRIPENALTIDQLVLQTAMRSRLQKISNRMINIDTIEAMGGSVPSGVLFYGPAGTGKTVAAMALAKASNWAFIKTSGHDLLYSPNKIDEIMRLAKDIRPTIIFIDEADDVLADRRHAAHSKDVTNKLLTVMDGAGGKVKDVLFIAATNAPDLIDEAMLRGGRFTEKIGFDVPDSEALLEYISKWINNSKAPLAAEFTASAVTSILQGQSLANVSEILQSAVNEAISHDEVTTFQVNLGHLEAGLKLVKGNDYV